MRKPKHRDVKRKNKNNLVICGPANKRQNTWNGGHCEANVGGPSRAVSLPGRYIFLPGSPPLHLLKSLSLMIRKAKKKFSHIKE